MGKGDHREKTRKCYNCGKTVHPDATRARTALRHLFAARPPLEAAQCEAKQCQVCKALVAAVAGQHSSKSLMLAAGVCLRCRGSRPLSCMRAVSAAAKGRARVARRWLGGMHERCT